MVLGRGMVVDGGWPRVDTLLGAWEVAFARSLRPGWRVRPVEKRAYLEARGGREGNE